MFNLKACITAAFVAAMTLAALPTTVMAQGCGPQNPNCIVPTAPYGTSNNQAASTAFVQGAISGGPVPYTSITGVPANSFLGNNTGSPASAIAMSKAQATALLNQFSSSLQGLAPASGGGTANFLRADGSFALPSNFSSSNAGYVPASGGGTADFLRADGTFAIPPGTAATASYSTRAVAIAATVPAAIATIVLQGYAAANDNGGGIYTKLASPPGVTKAWHFQSADGAWWQLVANPVLPRQVGAVIDGSTDEPTALQAWLDYGATFGVTSYGQRGTSIINTATLNLSANTVVDGGNVLTIKRNSNVVAGLVECNSLNNIVVRNLQFDTSGGFSSSTSIVVANGAHTFTVAAGLTGLVNGNFVQITANSSGASRVNYMIAQITSYSGTTLVVNTTTAVGSGTFAAWLIDSYPLNGDLAESPIALRFQFCNNIIAENNAVNNRFYNAIDTRNGNSVIFTRNRVFNYVNRGIHMASYVAANSAINNQATDNFVNGNLFSQYGINTSASDGASLTAMLIHGNTIINTTFQGIIVAGGVGQAEVSDNSVTMAMNSNGVGILVESLNGTSGNQIPQNVTVSHNAVSSGVAGIEFTLGVFYSTITGNSVTGSGVGYVLAGSATLQVLYSTITGNIANSCVSHGFQLTGSGASGAFGNTIIGNTSISNGGWGFISDANTGKGIYIGNVALSNTAGAYSLSGVGDVSTSGNI